MKARGIVAVVPMKPLRLAKSRLAGRLTPEERASLSLHMLRHVLGACLAAGVADAWVIGSEDAVRQTAEEMGAQWRADTGLGLNGVLARAFQEAFALGLAPMYLPADLPLVTPGEVGGLTEASGQGQRLALSPAQRDGGTNAIIAPPDTPFRPALGADSFRLHVAQAEALGLPLAVYRCRGLALDLDTPDDLDALSKLEPGLLQRLGHAVS